MERHCIVAGLHFVADTDDGALLKRLSPRYAPFSRDASACAGVPAAFVLRQTEQIVAWADARVMSEFRRDDVWIECAASDAGLQVSLFHEENQSPDGRVLFARMQCGRDFTSAQCWLSGSMELREYGFNTFLMMLFAFAALERQTLLFHASVVAHKDKAYLFLAESGTGKSTHAALWLKHVPDTELVNDDNPAVGLRDGRAIVYGTPWSGKTPCYRDVQYEAGGFVQIVRDKTDHIRRMDSVPAFAALLPSTSGINWDQRLYRTQGDTVASLVSLVPVYVLGCTPRRTAAVTCAVGVGAWDGTETGSFSLNEASIKPSGVSLPEDHTTGGQSQRVQVSNEAFAQEVSAQLQAGHSVTFRVLGCSMRPFLEDDRDKVRLVSPDRRPIRTGEVVLAHTDDGRYVLHRVVDMDGSHCLLMGDGNVAGRERCAVGQVIGVAEGFYLGRKERYCAADGKVWRALSWLWVHTLWARRPLLCLYRGWHKVCALV